MSVKPILNDDQKEAFKAIQKFIEHPAADTFVLKGYAGTGKTFLMQHLASWLKDRKYNFSLLASTGRAAAVLRGKTGFKTKTVHGELYQFSRMDGAEDEYPDDTPIEQHGQLTLRFSLRSPDAVKLIYIIDESSMLSSEITDDAPVISFGSGNLLDDFFSAAANNKVIFVGDPGQLPPVKQKFSPALEMDWLANKKRTAITITLEKIERSDADNDILVLASMVRNMSLNIDQFKYPKLPAANLNNVSIYESEEELFQSYLAQFKEAGSDGTIAIARSNRKVNELNRSVRTDLYQATDIPLQVHDILMITHNNGLVPLTNGDFVKVKELGANVMSGSLMFQTVKVQALLSNEEFELLLSLDVLYGNEINFTKAQQQALMIDLMRRMKTKGIGQGSEKFHAEMMKDSYLNCLRGKYGYAVTCHKAQGGEWNDVFLFLEKSMYAMPQSELFRWWYTAITRAKSRLHLHRDWWIR